MPLTVATWNINSVRLRIRLVTRLLREQKPDVLCLQETKCPDANFPFKALRRAGYEHIEINGQKGYHGVAIVSRLPLHSVDRRGFCGKGDARHIAATVEHDGRPITIHNLYVPAGGDEPDPEINPKFHHKLSFLEELHGCMAALSTPGSILVGDLNVAPLETDVWSHKQLLARREPHAAGDRTLRARPRRRRLGRSHAPFRAAGRKALHLVELSLARLDEERPRPPPRPHLGDARPRPTRDRHVSAQSRPRLEAPIRPRAGHRDVSLRGYASLRHSGAAASLRESAADAVRILVQCWPRPDSRAIVDSWRKRLELLSANAAPLHPAKMRVRGDQYPVGRDRSWS